MSKNLEQRVEELEKIVKALQGKTVTQISKKLGIGDTFELNGLKWSILDITDKGYLCLADKYGKDVEFDLNNNKWTTSKLRAKLNGDFLKKLEESVCAENIISFDRDLLSLDGQTEYGTCDDKVSILTVDEYRKYRKLIPNGDYYWWLITPWSTTCNGYERSVSVVSPAGSMCYDGCNGGNGVRPFCIFSSTIFESEE